MKILQFLSPSVIQIPRAKIPLQGTIAFTPVVIAYIPSSNLDIDFTSCRSDDREVGSVHVVVFYSSASTTDSLSTISCSEGEAILS